MENQPEFIKWVGLYRKAEEVIARINQITSCEVSMAVEHGEALFDTLNELRDDLLIKFPQFTYYSSIALRIEEAQDELCVASFADKWAEMHLSAPRDS